MTVRKATLNGPKPFGYFWASKVTKKIDILELLRRFDYFWASKVTKKIGVHELLRRFWLLLGFKSNKENWCP